MTMTMNNPLNADGLRQAITAHCVTGSWFAVRPLLMRMQTLPERGPELVADLLSTAGARSRTEAERLQRRLSHGLWRASAGPSHGARQVLTLHCGGARWTVRLLLQPQLHIETIHC